MKYIPFRFVISLLLTAIAFSASAQSYFACNKRELCHWNSNSKEFEDCSGGEDDSLFKINEDETMFKHTTQSISSAYYINGKEWDEERKIMTYKVVSDAGNSYTYFFDMRNYLVKALGTSDGEPFLVIFHVRRMWKQSE